MRILVTGAAGFIGSRLTERLIARGDEVLGYDNLNDYYDPTLKDARLARLTPLPDFSFVKGSLEDRETLEAAFDAFKPDRVVNLAAQAGVRYSLENPRAYIDSNIVGFLNILEACRHRGVEHLVYASSSSVYGANRKLPFAVEDSVDHPVSLYAASKKSNELMAHTYSHLFGLPTTGLRFFTVYGPWGRPDMALFLFTKKILAGEPIDVFNHGRHTRDFTYIDDIVESIVRLRLKPPRPAEGKPPCQLFNIGRGQPVRLLHFVECLEDALGIKAQRDYLPLQAGDVLETWADVSSLARWIDFSPGTSLEHGVNAFVGWYRDFYRV